MKTYYAKNRKEWRNWLSKNHNKAKEIFLIYYKKNIDKPTISYDDSVEEALCFGWIDSRLNSIDDEKYVRRFTPRKPKSVWSLLNRTRAEKMIKAKKMTKAGLLLIEEAKKSGMWDKAGGMKEEITVPGDFLAELRKNKPAFNNFHKMSVSVRFMYAKIINDAKQEKTRIKRIKRAVELIEKNLKPIDSHMNSRF